MPGEKAINTQGCCGQYFSRLFGSGGLIMICYHDGIVNLAKNKSNFILSSIGFFRLNLLSL